MRKYLVLVGLVILLCSLSMFAKATYDFETAGEEDNLMAAEGFTMERSSENAYNLAYSLKVVLDTGGTGFNVYTTSYEDNPLNSDLAFMTDTLFVYLYLPDVGPDTMSNIQPFTQGANWKWRGAQQAYSSASLDQWDCYPVVVDSLDYEGVKRELPIKRSGVQFQSVVENPGVTIYIDWMSTLERGTSGIKLIQDPDKVTLESSINGIKFTIDESTPVLVSVYNLMGAKVAEKAPGCMTAGSHEISVDLPNGMYIVKIVAGKVSATNKLLIVN